MSRQRAAESERRLSRVINSTLTQPMHAQLYALCTRQVGGHKCHKSERKYPRTQNAKVWFWNFLFGTIGVRFILSQFSSRELRTAITSHYGMASQNRNFGGEL